MIPSILLLSAGEQGLMYALRITLAGVLGTSRRQGARDTGKRDLLRLRSGKKQDDNNLTHNYTYYSFYFIFNLNDAAANGCQQ
jgi:hypothetical protein